MCWSKGTDDHTGKAGISIWLEKPVMEQRDSGGIMVIFHFGNHAELHVCHSCISLINSSYTSVSLKHQALHDVFFLNMNGQCNGYSGLIKWQQWKACPSFRNWWLMLCPTQHHKQAYGWKAVLTKLPTWLWKSNFLSSLWSQFPSSVAMKKAAVQRSGK